MTDAERFLKALAQAMPVDQRLIFCGFAGNPETAAPTAWRPRPWKPGDLLPINPHHTNGYITISSFHQSADRSWRRRNEAFGTGLAIMVDDVRTKVPISAVGDAAAPSAIIETSPGNEQWWYFLEPTDDKTMFDATIKAFIASKLMGDDPGMNGVNRVGRIPDFVNGKPKYFAEDKTPWRVKLVSPRSQLNNRYHLEQIKSMFGLKLSPVRRRRVRAPIDAEYRVKMFMAHYRWLAARGMLKRVKPNLGGWIEMRCPWMDEHTGRADTGAAISQPNEENEWYGGFQCHHGHCIDRNWGTLTEWVAQMAEEELEAINEYHQDERRA